MPNVPRRREVLKYAGTAGAAVAVLGLPPAPTAAAATPDVSTGRREPAPLDIVVFGEAMTAQIRRRFLQTTSLGAGLAGAALSGANRAAP